MIDSEVTNLPTEMPNPYELALTVYLRGIAMVLLILGLRHWLYIAGLFNDPDWSFQTMSTQWQLTTMHLAVVDLVAAVGLWMRVAWGNVLWIYAAIFEIVMHVAFSETFGAGLLIVAFHVITLIGFVALVVLARRAEPK